VTANEKILKELREIQLQSHHLSQIPDSEEMVSKTGKVFRQIFRMLETSNTWSFEEATKGMRLGQLEVHQCDVSILGLRFIWQERDWFNLGRGRYY